MKKRQVLKMIGGLCIGAGLGVSIYAALGNVLAAVFIELGSGICYAVTLGAFKKE